MLKWIARFLRKIKRVKSDWKFNILLVVNSILSMSTWVIRQGEEIGIRQEEINLTNNMIRYKENLRQNSNILRSNKNSEFAENKNLT